MAESNTKDKEDKAKVDFVNNFYSESYRSQKPKIDRWSRYYKLYRSHNYRTDIDQRRSNPFLPRTFGMVETLVARYMTALFVNQPLFALLPVNEKAKNTITKAETVLERYLHYGGIFQALSRLIKMMIVFDTAWIMPWWATIVKPTRIRSKKSYDPFSAENTELRYSFQDVMQLVYQGLKFDVRPPHSVYPDPYASDMGDSEGIILEEWVSKNRVKELAKSRNYKNLAEVEKSTGSKDIHLSAEQKSKTEIGLSAPGNNKNLVRLQHFLNKWEIITLANQQVLIGERENDIMPGTIPVLQSMKTVDPLQLEGIGSVQPIEKLQMLINMTAKQVMDHNAITVNPLIAYRQNAGIDPDRLISYPGNRIRMRDPQRDVKIISADRPLSLPWQIMNMYNQNFDEAPGVFGYQRGNQPTSKSETATLGTLLASQGDLRIKFDILTLEFFTLIPLAKFCFKLIQDNMPETIEVRFLGTDKPTEVTLDEILIPVDMYCRASSSLLKEVDQQMFLQLYSLIAPNPLIANNPQSQRELVKRLFEIFKQPGFEKIVPEQEGMIPVELQPIISKLLGLDQFLGGNGGGKGEGTTGTPPQKMAQPRSAEEMTNFLASKMRVPTGRNPRAWATK